MLISENSAVTIHLYHTVHSHPIRLLGLGVSNQKNATAQEQQPWVELELEFEPWPEA